MALQFLSSASPASFSRKDELGGALLGAAVTAAPDGPVQTIRAPLLDGPPSLRESWLPAAPAIEGVSDGIRWRRAGDVLFGVLDLDEADFAGAGAPLQAASNAAYDRIFRLLAAQQLPHLWRVWNYIADINGESHGLERYRQFNIGRQDAFLAHRRGTRGNVPAACALGLADGPLSVAFLAGATASIAIENPRQVSAYNYPAEYGPRSPTFSRAALVHPHGQEILFISGTASIVGHETVHRGDVARQCQEAMANIAAVVGEANRYTRSRPFTLADLLYRVYVRHAKDFPLIRSALLPLIGAAEVVFVQCDICRADLLLEIEAMATHALDG